MLCVEVAELPNPFCTSYLHVVTVWLGCTCSQSLPPQITEESASCRQLSVCMWPWALVLKGVQQCIWSHCITEICRSDHSWTERCTLPTGLLRVTKDSNPLHLAYDFAILPVGLSFGDLTPQTSQLSF